MEANKLLVCLCANQTNYCRSRGIFLLYFAHANEASRAERQKNILSVTIYAFGLYCITIAS